MKNLERCERVGGGRERWRGKKGLHLARADEHDVHEQALKSSACELVILFERTAHSFTI